MIRCFPVHEEETWKPAPPPIVMEVHLEPNDAQLAVVDHSVGEGLISLPDVLEVGHRFVSRTGRRCQVTKRRRRFSRERWQLEYRYHNHSFGSESSDWVDHETIRSGAGAMLVRRGIRTIW